MKKLIKKLMVLAVLLVVGCSDNGEIALGGKETPDQPSTEWPEYPEWQVYSEWSGDEPNPARYDASVDLTGTPYITSAIYDAVQGWDNIPSSTTFPNSVPWVIRGQIENGILAIDFPKEDLTLSEEYGSDWTQGAKIAEIHIQHTNFVHLALHKYDNKGNSSRIYIYYADNDFNRFNGGAVHLKKGWNFVEVRWGEVNGYYQRTVGLVTQDITDFIKKGYRWQIEFWF
ncbi:MAG: hypothetical protein LBK25_08505 [Treponema sp.]|jgi:hypothetical protein|nr:hypothetical protein [Treponema sp.]